MFGLILFDSVCAQHMNIVTVAQASVWLIQLLFAILCSCDYKLIIQKR